ncbi:hypothetical protein HanRHA438_Chr11g0510451 [Helianthus annuus]|nr:hypothetical protein HanRHA438_Chr11g0510451 [Helianthus annuus]
MCKFQIYVYHSNLTRKEDSRVPFYHESLTFGIPFEPIAILFRHLHGARHNHDITLNTSHLLSPSPNGRKTPLWRRHTAADAGDRRREGEIVRRKGESGVETDRPATFPWWRRHNSDSPGHSSGGGSTSRVSRTVWFGSVRVCSVSVHTVRVWIRRR